MTDQSEAPTTEKGPQGCPTTVYDGPYRHRCGLGARVGVCAYHGPFEQPTSRPGQL